MTAQQKMKKSMRKIVWRTGGWSIGRELLARGFNLDDTIIGIDTTDHINGYGGNDTLIGMGGADRMRWRLIAANDVATKAWRVAA